MDDKGFDLWLRTVEESDGCKENAVRDYVDGLRLCRDSTEDVWKTVGNAVRTIDDAINALPEVVLPDDEQAEAVMALGEQDKMLGLQEKKLEDAKEQSAREVKRTRDARDRARRYAKERDALRVMILRVCGSAEKLDRHNRYRAVSRDDVDAAKALVDSLSGSYSWGGE